MKCYGVLLVSVMVLASEIEAVPLSTLHNLNDIVALTVDFLEAYKTAFGVNSDKKIASYLKNDKETVMNDFSDIFVEVQEKLTGAHNEGKNVEHCNEKFKPELQNSQDKVMPALDRCFREQTPDWSKYDGQFDMQIVRGQNLLKKNQQIGRDCVSPLPWVTQRCVAKKLPKIKISVALYKRAVKKLRETLAKAFDAGKVIFNECAKAAVFVFKCEAGNAKKNALECIKNSN